LVNCFHSVTVGGASGGPEKTSTDVNEQHPPTQHVRSKDALRCWSRNIGYACRCPWPNIA